VPLASPVADAIARRLPDDRRPSTLVFAGPGGSNGVPAGSRTLLTRDNLRRAYHTAVTRAGDPVTRLAYTPRRVLRALREAGPSQTPESLRDRLRGRVPTARTVRAALCELEAAGLAVRHAVDDGGPPRWSAVDSPLDDALAKLKLRGPHDLRHTFSTWLEDAGIPARVIDELMGHAGGRRGGGEQDGRGSVIGLRYRHTTPEMEARVVAAIEQRLATSLAVAAQINR